MDAVLSDWSFFGSASDQGLLNYFFGRHASEAQLDASSLAPRDGRASRPIANSLIYPPYECPQRTSFCHFTGPHKPWIQLPSDAYESGKFWGRCTQHWHDIFNSLELVFPAVWADKLDAVLSSTQGVSSTESATFALKAALKPISLRSGSLLRSLHVPLIRTSSFATMETATNHVTAEVGIVARPSANAVSQGTLLPWAFMHRDEVTGKLAVAADAEMKGIAIGSEKIVRHVSGLTNE